MNELRKYIDILTESQELVIDSAKKLERMLSYGSVHGLDVTIYFGDPGYIINFQSGFTIHGNVHIISESTVVGDLTVNGNIILSIESGLPLKFHLTVNGSVGFRDSYMSEIKGQLNISGDLLLHGRTSFIKFPPSATVGGKIYIGEDRNGIDYAPTEVINMWHEGNIINYRDRHIILINYFIDGFIKNNPHLANLVEPDYHDMDDRISMLI